MAIISRGFAGRRNAAEAKLPPGQYLTTDFPVLSAGPTPRVSLDRWSLRSTMARTSCSGGIGTRFGTCLRRRSRSICTA